MDDTQELVWCGLAHPTEEQAVHLVANILSEFSAVKKEGFGHYSIEHFDIANTPFIVIWKTVLWLPTVQIGFGTPWPTQEAALANLGLTRWLLSQFRIPGDPSVWKLSTGPVRVG